MWDETSCGDAERPCLIDGARVDLGFYAHATVDIDGDTNVDAVGVTTLGQWTARASAPWTFGTRELGYGNTRGGVLFDVDTDGDLDIVRLLESALLVGRYESDTFLDAERWPVGDRNYAPSMADVDGDGALDLLFVDADGDQVVVVFSILPGVGPQLMVLPTGDNPLDVDAADLDGDGRIDLVVASANIDALEVLRGLGDGLFAPWTAVPTGDSPRSSAIADFDGDGDLDLASANHDDDTLTIALAQAGDWTPTSIVAPCPQPRDIVAVALEDGLVDLVVRSAEVDELYALAGGGDGTFTSTGSLAGEWDTMSVVDIEGDGDVAVLVSGTNLPTVALQGHDLQIVGGYPGVGLGVVSDGDLYVLGESDRVVWDVADGAGPLLVPSTNPVLPWIVSDLDDDGAMDLVGKYDGKFAALPSDGAVGFGAAVLTQVPAAAIIAARLDDDAWPDFIAVDPAGCVALHGDGAFGFVARPLAVDCLAARFGDANGDERTDVLEVDDGVLRISTIDRGVLVPWISGDAADMTAALVGDIDGDGVPDVAARRGCCRLFVWSGLSDAGMGEPWQLILPEDRLDTIALEDLDGDDRPELVSRDQNLWVIAHDDDDTWLGTRWSTSACEWTSRHDLDGDGVMDLLRGHADGIIACTSTPP